jgi:ferrous iron transport protein A
MKTLKDVPPGQSAVVEKVTVAGTVRLRLMAMGLLKGARVKIIKVAPLGDPIEITIGGYHLSLRKAEAEKIMVI